MVELLCTVTGILAGSAAVATILQKKSGRGRTHTDPPSSVDESLRLKGLADKLQLLTHRVAADVSAHSERVSTINERLDPAEQEPGLILSAINDLIEANSAMQSQLADAQNQIHEQSRKIEATATEARTDALTGLANRRALNEYLDDRMQSPTPHEVTALLMIDIDHFKSCNDTHGHLAGDAVLAMFASRIAQWSNSNFYAARYGGEEFAVVIHGTNFDDIATHAALLRAQISEQAIAYMDLSLQLTASAGLTELIEGESIESTYRRADEGLYMAKKNGRNCGYMLKDNNWVRFSSDKVTVEADASTPAHHQTQLDTAEAKSASLLFAAANGSDSVPARTNLRDEETAQQNTLPPLAIEQNVIAEQVDATNDDIAADVLDLKVFLHRLEVHLTQLSRGDLPATAIILDAVGLADMDPRMGEACWTNTLSLIQQQVRGIDVICRINQQTVCIFMPGSKLDAALDRATRMQQSLSASHQNTTPFGPFPDRFSIALASVTRYDSAGVFMQRLEEALDEARDARPGELIIHDGKTIRSQPA